MSESLLLTREQAAELCQVSVQIIDEWSYLPDFPVIRRNGGHFVRIHRAALEQWLEDFATQRTTPAAISNRAGVVPSNQRRTTRAQRS